METYRIENSDPSGLAVFSGTGTPIALDVVNPEYCEFLSWAALQSPPPTPFEDTQGKGRFFDTVDEVVRECKRRCLTLDVNVIQGVKVTTLHQTDGFRLKLGGGRGQKFYPLLKTVAAPDGSWGALSGAGTAIEPTGIVVGQEIWDELNRKLPDEDSDVRRLSSWPVERAFVYVDVSDFSKFAPGQQLLVINSLIQVADGLRANLRDAAEKPEASLCIGDGYIYAFKSARGAAEFAKQAAVDIEFGVATKQLPIEFHFRIGVHIGPVYRFWDPGREGWNYLGDGINGGNRVLSAVGKDADDVVFVSSAIRSRLIAEPEQFVSGSLVEVMQNRGRRTDKHGKPWRVYELNHGAVRFDSRK